MARKGKKAVKISKPLPALFDATPERLAKGDLSVFVNPAEIDSTEQRIGRVRRFRGSNKVESLYQNDRLTYSQYAAAEWYRATYERCQFTTCVTSNYGERTSSLQMGYGLARSESQARARDLLKDARSQFPKETAAFMDRLIIHNSLPRYGGNQYLRTTRQIAHSLQTLASWLRLV